MRPIAGGRFGKAAWELYVELVTRLAVVPLGTQEGLLREALSSLYSLFATTRDILRRCGPEIAEPKPDGQYGFAVLAVVMLNYGLYPLLARWHLALEDWEACRPPDRSRREHEKAWDHIGDLRAAVEHPAEPERDGLERSHGHVVTDATA
jgi:hypothetical protein